MKKAIFTDAMFTLFTPLQELDRYDIYQNLISRFKGVHVPKTKIQKFYDRNRQALENNLPADHGKKWTTITKHILYDLFPAISEAQALEIAGKITEEFLTGKEFYEVREDTRSFLLEAQRRGLRVIVASNNDLARLHKTIEQFGLKPLLSSVYASTEIGFEKPHPKFFEKILAAENLQPSECLMIGNNPNNDFTGAKNVGIEPVLYDQHNKYPNFSGLRVRQFSELWNLNLLPPNL